MLASLKPRALEHVAIGMVVCALSMLFSQKPVAFIFIPVAPVVSAVTMIAIQYSQWLSEEACSPVSMIVFVLSGMTVAASKSLVTQAVGHVVLPLLSRY